MHQGQFGVQLPAKDTRYVDWRRWGSNHQPSDKWTAHLLSCSCSTSDQHKCFNYFHKGLLLEVLSLNTINVLHKISYIFNQTCRHVACQLDRICTRFPSHLESRTSKNDGKINNPLDCVSFWPSTGCSFSFPAWEV